MSVKLNTSYGTVTMNGRFNIPYGPMQSDLAVHLIGQQILFAQHEEGLGSYGVLDSINFGQPRPYQITTERGTKVQADWVVKWG